MQTDTLNFEDEDSVLIPADCPAFGKCEHGIYISAGDETARYCGACNPATYGDSVLAKAMRCRKEPTRNYAEPKTLDACAFLALPAEERMATVTGDYYL